MINTFIENITTSVGLEVSDSFEMAKVCSKALRSDKDVLSARKLVVHILENWSKIPEVTHDIWIDIIESAGFYPYIEKNNFKLKSTSSKIRLNYHKSDCLNDIVFHQEQESIRTHLDKNRNIILSAPTSFGKSLLIEYIVAERKYRNIVVIQPTLALLDETRKKLKKYSDEYKIIVRTSQEPSTEKGNIFLLTAERVMEYSQFTTVDFLVVDEFYKFSAKRDDERSDVLNNACYKLFTRYKPKFYFLGPNIDGISKGFESKYNALFLKTNFSLIDNKIIDMYTEHKAIFDRPRKGRAFKESVLFDLLIKLENEQTIIYCSSPSRVRQLASRFVQYLSEEGRSSTSDLPIIEWMEKNIHPKWNVIDFLHHKIGINDGALQKHINSTMVDYFNEGSLKYMFCTSTIIEGVNTSAKNVVIFDEKKGKDIILDFFDYSNIVGRSGRMMIHYIGKVYNFIEPPKQHERMIVDIPFHQQNPIKDEVLINLLEEDVINKETQQYRELEKIPEDVRSLVKRNGLLVQGQLKILKEISDLDRIVTIKRNNYEKNYTVGELLLWMKYPTYDQLQYIYQLCFENLIKPTETVRPMTYGKLTKMTMDYGNDLSLPKLIVGDYQYRLKSIKKDHTDELKLEVLNISIREVFNISRHWFKYKIPKWFSVMNELQAFVFARNNLEAGNYSFYSTLIENEAMQSNMTIFSEYGIPVSAIKKLQKHIPSNLPEDKVLPYLKERKIYDIDGMLNYEKWKIKQLI
jgi:hypothetical protein